MAERLPLEVFAELDGETVHIKVHPQGRAPITLFSYSTHFEACNTTMIAATMDRAPKPDMEFVAVQYDVKVEDE